MSSNIMTTDPAQEFDFEALLKSDGFASDYNVIKRGTVIYRTSGSLSTIASICTIVHILRSHHGLSTTYHRLVFGLAIGDILYSFIGFVLGDIMAPKEYGYLVPGAIGNQASCDAQGFLSFFGAAMGLFYNSSICLYYLAIVTFNKKDNYIRTKLEPWLHGISILIPLALCSAILAINGYNTDKISNCYFTPNSVLPHCEGLESGEIRDGFTIPCGRGDGRAFRFLYIFTFSGIFLTPVVIVVTMALMYRTVHKNEKKIQKYGVGSLRLRKKAASNNLENNTNGNTTTRNNSPPDLFPLSPHDNEDSGNHSRFSFIQWLKAIYTKILSVDSCCSSERNKLRKTTLASQKRAILHRAVGYVTAWGLSWIPRMVIGVNGMVRLYIHCFLHPLQGVFNFIAYMFPKVRNAKKGPTKRSSVRHGGAGNGNHANAITWRQAFLKASMSRGPKKISGQHHARINGSSNGAWKNNILKALKTLKTLITALSSSRRRMNKNSNNSVVNINQPQEIRPPVPGSVQGENMIPIADAPPPAQNNSDYESPAPTLERNVYTGSPPLVLSEDANDLKKGYDVDGGGDNEEYHLNNTNDTESLNNEDMGDVLYGVYLSEEIQSILE